MKSVDHKTRDPRRVLGVTLIAVLFLVLAVPAVRFTAGQFHYEKGRSLSLQGQYSQAVELLEKAAEWQPNDASIQHQLGLVNLRIALQLDNYLQKVMANKAIVHLQKAQELNPLEPDTAYALGRAAVLLGESGESLVLSSYRRATGLWPNNSLYHYALARELYQQDHGQELLATAQTLGRIDPAGYGKFHRESFWSDEVQQAFSKGLHEAVDSNFTTRQAHLAISAILARQGDWADAADHYQQAMAVEQHRNTSQNYYQLGRLLLYSNHLEEADAAIFQGLAKSRTREKDLEKLYHVFNKTVSPDIQLAFYRKVRERYSLSKRLEMLMARTLVDAKQYEEARNILGRIAAYEDLAEAYYLLAKVAEQEKNWDKMELASQKAAVRDPDNSEYRMKFSQSLARQQKYAAAEQEATKAISLRDKPSAWYYSHRASMRWSQKKYEGALDDWQQANKINPENASFYSYIGRAYKKLGYEELAMIAYGSALAYDPGNERYKKELGQR